MVLQPVGTNVRVEKRGQFRVSLQDPVNNVVLLKLGQLASIAKFRHHLGGRHTIVARMSCALTACV